MSDAAALIVATLGLREHPEGGWFTETWRAPEIEGRRPVGSAILYLIGGGDRSRWHTFDAAEVWHYAAGDALELSVWEEGGKIVRHRIGGEILAGDQPQAVVPADVWQSARSLGDWTLVGCIVTPAFEYESFRLAPEDWEPPT